MAICCTMTRNVALVHDDEAHSEAIKEQLVENTPGSIIIEINGCDAIFGPIPSFQLLHQSTKEQKLGVMIPALYAICPKLLRGPCESQS